VREKGGIVGGPLNRSIDEHRVDVREMRRRYGGLMRMTRKYDKNRGTVAIALRHDPSVQSSWMNTTHESVLAGHGS
jgi:hypothetical protein